MYYAKKNYGYGTVLTPPSPADSGTTLVLGSGQGADFADPATSGTYPINIWPANTQPSSSNAEIALVTAKSSDTLTITRAQESTVARSVIAGDQVSAVHSADVATKSTHAVWFLVNQNTHGFVAGDVIYFNGTIWAKAKADALATLGTHLVASVLGTNYFIAVSSGRATVTAHGLTLGSRYYLSAGTAGLLTTTEPTTGYSQPFVIPETADVVHVLAERAVKLIGDTGLSEGILVNGKISRTVSSNNLTIAIKTLAGADPSASDPVYVTIQGTKYTLTAALSLTLNAGTNYFSRGTTFVALPSDLFTYLGVRSGAVFIGASPIPYGTLYSDFSTTNTDTDYLAYSGSAPSSTDPVVNIGKCNVQMSAAASYNWSVPTTSIVISYPIQESEFYTWIPTVTGFSANPTATYQYKVMGRHCLCIIDQTADGTSNATTLTITAPFSGKTYSSAGYWHFGRDNGATITSGGRLTTGAGSNVITANTNFGSGGWTAANGKRIIARINMAI